MTKNYRIVRMTKDFQVSGIIAKARQFGTNGAHVSVPKEWKNQELEIHLVSNNNNNKTISKNN
jgi:ribosomal protein S8E